MQSVRAETGARPRPRRLDPERLGDHRERPTGPHGGAEWIAVFERNGRTCVLAGVVHRRGTLVKLASWQGRGAVAF